MTCSQSGCSNEATHRVIIMRRNRANYCQGFAGYTALRAENIGMPCLMQTLDEAEPPMPADSFGDFRPQPRVYEPIPE